MPRPTVVKLGTSTHIHPWKQIIPIKYWGHYIKGQGQILHIYMYSDNEPIRVQIVLWTISCFYMYMYMLQDFSPNGEKKTSLTIEKRPFMYKIEKRKKRKQQNGHITTY